jgi:predicted alpha/beta superfamily hydrolase
MSTVPSQVTIPNTELHTLNSSIVNQEFSIFVALPDTYAKGDKAYPVLYMVDANADFGIVTGTLRSLTFLNDIPEVVVVGIGYPVGTFKEALGFRTRDLTPTETDWYETRLKSIIPDAPVDAGSGGAANFLRFFREELMPFVNTTFRVMPENNAFMGFSLGGLFALYSLFSQPDTFARYIVGDPSLWWNDGMLFGMEKEFASRNRDPSAKVFLSVSGSDAEYMIADMYKMADALRSRELKSLELKTRFFDGETHTSGYPAFVSWGLRVAWA